MSQTPAWAPTSWAGGGIDGKSLSRFPQAEPHVSGSSYQERMAVFRCRGKQMVSGWQVIRVKMRIEGRMAEGYGSSLQHSVAVGMSF